MLVKIDKRLLVPDLLWTKLASKPGAAIAVFWLKVFNEMAIK